MKRYPKGLSVLFLLFFLISNIATAQTQLGIRLQVTSEQSIEDLSQDLNLIDTLGINWVEIEGNPNKEVLSQLNQNDLSIYLLSDIQFVLTPYLLGDNELLNKMTSMVGEKNDSTISGYILIRNSQTYKEEFAQDFKVIVDSLRSMTNKEIFIHSPLYKDDLPSFDYLDDVIFDVKTFSDSTLNINKVMFNKVEYSAGDERVINQLLTSAPSILIIQSEWLRKASERNQGLIDVLSSFNEINTPLPIPRKSPVAPNSNWNVLVLVILWITIITHYAYHPNYRTNAFRYFFSHNYFVKDIMEYRIRNTSNGIIILMQHAVTGGLFFYYLMRASFSDAGIKSFFYNLPYVTFIGDTFLSVFVLGVIIIAVFQIIAIIWISLANKEIRHSSQILSLYSWPLQLNFLALTAMSVLFQIGTTNTWFYVLAVFFVMNWFNAFNMASVDTSRFKLGGRTVYSLLTIVLHLVSTVIAITLLYMFTPFFQAIELAYLLP